MKIGKYPLKEERNRRNLLCQKKKKYITLFKSSIKFKTVIVV